MIISPKLMQSLFIAQGMDELRTMCAKVSLCGHTGFPVVLIPFGSSGDDIREEILIRDEGELFSKGPHIIERGLHEMVHVIKAPPPRPR